VADKTTKNIFLVKVFQQHGKKKTISVCILWELSYLIHFPGICPRRKCGCLCGPRIPDWKKKYRWI